MKRLTLILTVLIAFFAFSCEERAVEVNHEMLITQGEWKVLMFFDEHSDKGRDFGGYTFTFSSGGQAVARANNVDTQGSWSVTDVDSQRKKMVISFNNAPLTEMKNDWFVRDIAEDKIELILIDQNNNSQNLVFTRVK